MRLKQAGIRYTVVEKNADVGGTWCENSYPGCRVDLPNHFYSLLVRAQPRLGRVLLAARRAARVLRARRATSYGVRDTCASRPRSSPRATTRTRARWAVHAARAATGASSACARTRIDQRGRAAQPPEHPGASRACDASRAGASTPRACADDVDARGQARRGDRHRRERDAGRAASSRAIARRLTVFQRSAQWALPQRRLLPAPVSAGQEVAAAPRAVLRGLVPLPAVLARRRRTAAGTADRPELAASAALDQRDQRRASRGRSPSTSSRSSASAPTCSRGACRTIRRSPSACCIDNGWFRTLNARERRARDRARSRGHASRHRQPDGAHHDARRDRVRHRLPGQPLPVADGDHGRDGARCASCGATTRARTSASPCPAFPNLFCLYGPNTNLAHGGSIIFHSECQVRYVAAAACGLLAQRGTRAMECKQSVHDAYNARVDAAHEQMVWSHPHVEQLVQEREGPRDDELAVSTGGLLGDDAGGGGGGFRVCAEGERGRERRARARARGGARARARGGARARARGGARARARGGARARARGERGGRSLCLEGTAVLGAVQAGPCSPCSPCSARASAGLRAAARGCARCSLRSQPGRLLRAAGCGVKFVRVHGLNQGESDASDL